MKMEEKRFSRIRVDNVCYFSVISSTSIRTIRDKKLLHQCFPPYQCLHFLKGLNRYNFQLI